MNIALAQRCVNHHAREAVARCPECTRFFCRECVSEHEDRVLCAGCLARTLRVERGGASRFGHLIRCCGAVIGICTAWWFFDLIGRGLLLLPSSVHAGAVWKEKSDE